MAEATIERVLVTAATGAVARHLIERLDERGVPVTAVARGRIDGLPAGVRRLAVPVVNDTTDWSVALSGVTHVVHCAALTRLTQGQDESWFDSVNHLGTRALAQQAAAAGARRFVHISTAAVAGRRSTARPIRVSDAPAPTNAYARSKLAAEAALLDIAAATTMEVAIVRPPRIIWPQLTGNLRLFEKLIRRGIPLPLGGLSQNARDNVSPDNLTSIIEACLVAPGASGRIFFATDEDPLSTRALASRIAARTNRRATLLPVPPAMIRTVVRFMPRRLLGGLNRDEMISELLDDFRLDTTETRERLGWRPVAGTL